MWYEKWVFRRELYLPLPTFLTTLFFASDLLHVRRRKEREEGREEEMEEEEGKEGMEKNKWSWRWYIASLGRGKVHNRE